MSLKINFERLMACKSRRQTRRSAGGGLFFVSSSRFYRSGRPALTCPGQFQPRHAQQVVSPDRERRQRVNRKTTRPPVRQSNIL